MKADSHKYIKSIIEKLPEKSQFKIVNIDFTMTTITIIEVMTITIAATG